MIVVRDNKTLTLKDSAGDGTIQSEGTVAIVIDDATLTIESGNFISGDVAFWAGGENVTGNIVVNNGSITSQEFAIGVGKDSTLTINDGEFKAKDNAVIAGNGRPELSNATININGGNFIGEIQTTGYTGCGVYMPNSKELNITGGTFTIDGCGICARAGKINISGGDFVSISTREGWVGDRTKVTIPAYGVYYDGPANYSGLSLGENSLNITGGTYTNSADTTMAGVKVVQPTNGETIQVNAGDWTVAE